jgi:hypothetical protein
MAQYPALESRQLIAICILLGVDSKARRHHFPLEARGTCGLQILGIKK